MSGGAFDYLSFKEPHEYISAENAPYVARAIDILNSLNRTKEATMLTKLLEHGAKVETLGNAVKDILYSIEWYASGDIGEEELIKELDEYLQARQTAQTVAVKDEADVDMLKRAMQTIHSPTQSNAPTSEQITQAISEALAGLLLNAESTE